MTDDGPDADVPATDAPGELPPTTRVGRVALRVADLDSVTAFYERVVGLAVQRRTPDRVTLGAGDEPLLELLAAPEAPARDSDETGLFHTAFRVPTRSALADALDRIDAEWHLDGASDHLVSEALYLADPESNGVEIYRDRPRAEWPTTEAGRVEMQTLPLDLDALREEAGGERAAPSDTTVGHVHLEVSSIPDARAFYADALGLRVRQTYGESALFVAAGDYHHHVGLNVWNRRRAPPSGRGLAWFELLTSEAGLDGVRRRLASRDVDVTTIESGIEVADPDGLRVRLVVTE